MKRISNNNINDGQYWDGVYGDRPKYERETGTTRFERAIDEVKNGDKFLDIGCGIGMMTKMVKNILPSCEVWGTDISKKAMADNTHERPDINYRDCLIGNQNVPSNYFDVVFSGEVLEHIDEPQLLFLDAHKALKQGGKFIITTPLLNRIMSLEHIWEFTHEDVKKFYNDTGFNRVRFIYLPNGESELIIMAVGIKL